LALIYALLDCPLKKVLQGHVEIPDLEKVQIKEVHLNAALAVWEYAEKSAYLLFHSHTGSKLGDKLLRLLANGPMTKDEMRRHLSARQKSKLNDALAILEKEKFARKTILKHEGAGRPAEQWELVSETKREHG
jgi:hypothetical protein